MPLPKSFTKVTPFTKFLALSLFVLLPVVAFFYGIYYEQKTHVELPFACKQWQTVCDPNYTDPNGGCAPKRICVDTQNDSLKTACEESGGKWLDEHKECESMESDKGLDSQACQQLGGEFKGCDSACRHSDRNGACITVCVKTCKFNK